MKERMMMMDTGTVWRVAGGAVAAGVVALGAGFSGTAPAAQQASAPRAPLAVTNVVHINTEIVNEKNGLPKYTHPYWTVRRGETVIFTIKSYDSGASPLSKDSPYNIVEGTRGGTETIDGRAVRRISDKDVAHTFTVPGLGLNVVVPAAPNGGSVTVVAVFKVPKAGSYDWQCEAPCGTTASGWGGPMVTPGWMEGTVTVKA